MFICVAIILIHIMLKGNPEAWLSRGANVRCNSKPESQKPSGTCPQGEKKKTTHGGSKV